MKLVIIVPALNEGQIILKTLKSLPVKIDKFSQVQVVVVDDGSTDNTKKLAIKTKSVVLSHAVNRGLGAAIKTGLEWSKKEQADIVVTFDADGQHRPEDIERIVQPIIRKEADVVIGSRFKIRQNVPLDRLLINWSANFISFFFFGIRSTDTQSGLRAFSNKAISKIDYKADRMEFSSEILIEAKRHNLTVKEIPIDAIYTSYSRNKGQKNINAIPVFARFLVKFLR